MSGRPGTGGLDMEQTLLEKPEVEQDAAKPIGAGGEVARTVLGVAAVKAFELSDHAADKAQGLARRRRR